MNKELFDFIEKYQKFNAVIEAGLYEMRRTGRVSLEMQNKVSESFYDVFKILNNERPSFESLAISTDFIDKMSNYCARTGSSLDLRKLLEKYLEDQMSQSQRR